MPDAPSPNGQFEFLNALRKGRASVTLYLINGIRLQGRIASFDRYSVLLQSRDGDVLIQNHAISTIGRDPGGGARRPREGGAGEHRGAPRPPREGGDRPPRLFGDRPPREPGERFARDPDAARTEPADRDWRRPAPGPAPTVTIVRKGLRRLRTPEGGGESR